MIDHNQLTKIIDGVLENKIITNFELDNYLATSEINGTNVRYIMNDFGLLYNISHLSSY